jgi:hypothetical protein
VKKPAVLGRALHTAVDLYNRSDWTENRLLLVPGKEGRLYAEDGLWTSHVHAFVEDAAYERAYQRGVAACAMDYHIRWRAHTVLWAATLGAKLDGAFVECGTGRGFMASAICEYLGWGERPFYLYDSFLPTAPDAQGLQHAGGEVHPAYAEGPEAVRQNFAQWPGVQLVVGRIPDTLGETGPVAFFHVDLNNAVSEEHAIRHFWPRLSPGAPMVLDDYAFEGYDAQREGADALADELGFGILALPSGQGLAIRPTG